MIQTKVLILVFTINLYLLTNDIDDKEPCHYSHVDSEPRSHFNPPPSHTSNAHHDPDSRDPNLYDPRPLLLSQASNPPLTLDPAQSLDWSSGLDVQGSRWESHRDRGLGFEIVSSRSRPRVRVGIGGMVEGWSEVRDPASMWKQWRDSLSSTSLVNGHKLTVRTKTKTFKNIKKNYRDLNQTFHIL